MRKKLFAVVILCAIALTGCKTKIDTQALNTLTSLSQITPADVKTRPMSLADSVTVNNVKGLFKIDADFPDSGNFFVINNIREWMSEQLGGTYEGNMEDGAKMLDHYKNVVLTDFKENIIPDMPRIEDMSCYKDVKIKKLYETDRYVSYLYTQEGFAGGAHGWYLMQGQTLWRTTISSRCRRVLRSSAKTAWSSSISSMRSRATQPECPLV